MWTHLKDNMCIRPVSPNTGHSARYLELARKLKPDRIVQLFRK